MENEKPTKVWLDFKEYKAYTDWYKQRDKEWCKWAMSAPTNIVAFVKYCDIINREEDDND